MPVKVQDVMHRSDILTSNFMPHLFTFSEDKLIIFKLIPSKTF